ncbi:hypothetical protein CfE428DRAFT_1076 [Chthoniobacter flavus Ellin428]|uniref:Uncharacterized protein n=1 Tax=Chthoniobacter flavus Ellin428 TaxID=497964 RepID=B4CWN8_9BACT|nr:hypothetical protein [Chthoniobacter flavus]EDY21830.1 hypothetical protein CfE428DRAFT_1076 [Chthoniobacter flavus Ellin428]TCO95757.1 hypothetical protein EV701_101448 [Chthoniobacter flavus]
MKYLPLLFAVVIGCTAVPVTTFAKDRRDDWGDYSKHVKEDVKALEDHYDQVKARVKDQAQGDRRLWSGLHDIKSNIDGIVDDQKSGRYEGLRSRVQQANDDLSRLQAQMEHNNNRRGGYYRRD